MKASNTVLSASQQDHQCCRLCHPHALNANTNIAKEHLIKSELDTTSADTHAGLIDVVNAHAIIDEDKVHVKEEGEEEKKEIAYYVGHMPTTMFKEVMMPSPPFSIRHFVSSVRRKDFLKCWPFSKRILEQCLMHGMKLDLPPFSEPPGPTNNIKDDDNKNNINKYTNSNDKKDTSSDILINKDGNNNNNIDRHLSNANFAIQTSCSGDTEVQSESIKENLMSLTPSLASTHHKSYFEKIDHGLEKVSSCDFQATHDFLKKESEEIESTHYSCCFDGDGNYVNNPLTVELTTEYTESNQPTSVQTTSKISTFNASKDLVGLANTFNALKPSHSESGSIEDLVLQNSPILDINVNDNLIHEHLKNQSDIFRFTINSSSTSASFNDMNERSLENPISSNASICQVLSEQNIAYQNANIEENSDELSIIVRNSFTPCKSLIGHPKRKDEEGKNLQIVPYPSVLQVNCPVCSKFSTTSNTTLNAHMDQCLMTDHTQQFSSPRRRIRIKKMRSMMDIYAVAPACNTPEELKSP